MARTINPLSGLSEFAIQRGEHQQDRGTARQYLLPEGAVLKPREAWGHAYAFTTEGIRLIGLADAILIPQSAQKRNLLMLRNSSPAAEIVFVSFNTTATTGSVIRLTVNQILLFDTVVPQDDVHVVSDTATGRVSYGFSTLPFDAPKY